MANHCLCLHDKSWIYIIYRVKQLQLITAYADYNSGVVISEENVKNLVLGSRCNINDLKYREQLHLKIFIALFRAIIPKQTSSLQIKYGALG